jgi:RNA polymerase sigma factor (sigma-70 family)
VSSVSTAELASAARAGDVAGFANLVERHRADLRAVAIVCLGYNAEADDVVQDAILIAMQRLGDLREPASVLPWLKTIVRNQCRMVLRGNRTSAAAYPEPEFRLDPADEFERADLQSWVREAVAGLSPAVREVTLLRYFSDFRSYREIAEVCGVRMETVRTRLREGRLALGRTLRATADGTYRDDDSAAEASRREAETTLVAWRDGGYRKLVLDRFHPRADVLIGGRLIGGRDEMVDLMESTRGDGVDMRFHDASASRDLMIWETGFVNPPEDPEHCPPTMVWLYSLKDQRIGRLRMAYGR